MLYLLVNKKITNCDLKNKILYWNCLKDASKPHISLTNMPTYSAEISNIRSKSNANNRFAGTLSIIIITKLTRKIMHIK